MLDDLFTHSCDGLLYINMYNKKYYDFSLWNFNTYISNVRNIISKYKDSEKYDIRQKYDWLNNEIKNL